MPDIRRCLTAFARARHHVPARITTFRVRDRDGFRVVLGTFHACNDPVTIVTRRPQFNGAVTQSVSEEERHGPRNDPFGA
jgi:hypothetical protein